MKAWTIVGYTYAADNYCPDCIRDSFVTLSGWEVGRTTEELLDHAADIRGIDRADEGSFDSGDFPKVILASMVETDERCGACHELLIS